MFFLVVINNQLVQLIIRSSLIGYLVHNMLNQASGEKHLGGQPHEQNLLCTTVCHDWKDQAPINLCISIM